MVTVVTGDAGVRVEVTGRKADGVPVLRRPDDEAEGSSMNGQRGSLLRQNDVVIACPSGSLAPCHATAPHQPQTVINQAWRLSSWHWAQPTLVRTQHLPPRARFDQARDPGGYSYPVGSIPMTRLDWRNASAPNGRFWSPPPPAAATTRRHTHPRPGNLHALTAFGNAANF
jgi:hypothetical protein